MSSESVEEVGEQELSEVDILVEQVKPLYISFARSGEYLEKSRCLDRIERYYVNGALHLYLDGKDI